MDAEKQKQIDAECVRMRRYVADIEKQTSEGKLSDEDADKFLSTVKPFNDETDPMSEKNRQAAKQRDKEEREKQERQQQDQQRARAPQQQEQEQEEDNRSQHQRVRDAQRSK
jgi:hypothetical protein